MKWFVVIMPLLLVCASPAVATTARDLRATILIDGNTSDFSNDDWILDASTPFAERAGDSRWGRDNDISRIAVTWDEYHLYVAVSAATASNTLMLFLDTGCGGVGDLRSTAGVRRNIDFGGITPNLLLKVSRPSTGAAAALVDCRSPLGAIDPDRFSSRFVQDATLDGALEVAIPWQVIGAFDRGAVGTQVPEENNLISILAAVTGGDGAGAGDAAPDPSVALDNDSTRVAILNNYMTLPLDADGNGLLDIGVSPRNVATVAVSTTDGVGSVLPLQVALERKVFSPEAGEVLRFRASLSPADYRQLVYLTARVYSADGHLLRTVLGDEPRDLSASAAAAWDEWDGRDSHGRFVPGGIYVLAVSGGVGSGVTAEVVRSSFAVIR
jgi:hypothetical protein